MGQGLFDGLCEVRRNVQFCGKECWSLCWECFVMGQGLFDGLCEVRRNGSVLCEGVLVTLLGVFCDGARTV